MLHEIENLYVVDNEDNVIESRLRQEVYDQGLPHRTVAVFVRDSHGNYWLQKRSADKSYCPGHWSMPVGGHVKFGETYEAAAQRESDEEMGRSLILTNFRKIKTVFDPRFPFRFVGVFEAVCDGPFTFDPKEVELFNAFPIETIQQMLVGNALIQPELRNLFEILYPSDATLK
jgi:isopentenyl-diphosphate Delta-isomerase